MRLPLSPEVAKTLLLTCFAEQDRWERSALAQEITRRFTAQGGITDTKSVISPLKRALSELRSEGLLISIGKGLWARVPEGSKDSDSPQPKRIPLQPMYAQDKVLALFDQRPVWERQELVDRLVADHLAAGHVIGSQPPLSVVKKVLGRLSIKGLVENVGKGLWRKSSGVSGESDTQLTQQGGVPLQPVLARRLIMQLFEQRPEWKRSALAEKLVAEHLALGNVLGTQDPLRVVKKALGYLQDAGRLKTDKRGNWQCIEMPTQVPVVPQSDWTPPLVEGDVKQAEIDRVSPNSMDEWVELGQGSEFVYLYYFDNDREISLLTGKKTWACKIGYTTDDVVRRVMSQTKTARAYKPRIAVVIRSDNALYLEGVIHNAFKLIDRHFGERDSIGYEWFDTCPEELIKWYSQFERLMLELNRANKPAT